MRTLSLALCSALTALPAIAEEPLVPVVVALRDLPAGTVITFEVIAQRLVPKSAVTVSIVKPDSASYVVNQRTRLPILAAEPLLWAFFEERVGGRVKACEGLQHAGTAEAQVARHRQVVRTRRAR